MKRVQDTGLPDEKKRVGTQPGETPEPVDVLARAEELVAGSRSRLAAQPAVALLQARAAQRLLRGAATIPGAVVLYARAMACEATSLLAQGDPQGADDVFAAARFMLRSQGLDDRQIAAELEGLEGRLRERWGKMDV